MHTLFCGVTESGKTTLARHIAREVSRAGQNVIVHDPVGTLTAGGGWPENALVFGEEESLFEYLARDDVGLAHVFIDEAGDMFTASKKHNLWLLTRGRHFGFQVHLIAQRPKMMLPTARTQCARGYIFRLAPEDAEEIGRDFGHSGLGKITLDKGEFLILQSGEAGIKRASLSDFLNFPKG